MFRESRQGAIKVISGSVPLSGDNLELLRTVVEESLAGGQPRAVLDLHEVALIDSAGLECLLDVLDLFEGRAGVLKLAGPNPLCADILSVTGVGDYFETFSDVNTAVGSFTQ